MLHLDPCVDYLRQAEPRNTESRAVRALSMTSATRPKKFNKCYEEFYAERRWNQYLH